MNVTPERPPPYYRDWSGCLWKGLLLAVVLAVVAYFAIGIYMASLLPRWG